MYIYIYIYIYISNHENYVASHYSFDYLMLLIFPVLSYLLAKHYD